MVISDRFQPLSRFLNGIKISNIWTEIIILDDNLNENIGIKNQTLLLLNKWKIDILHLFTYDLYSISFVNNISLDTKVIFTEEGTATYRPLEHYKWDHLNWKQRNIIKDEYMYKMNWDRIDEIMLFEPQLYDYSINKPLEKIDIKEILNNDNLRRELISKLNVVFDYKDSDEEYEIVYFDTYTCEINEISTDYEKYFLNNLIDIIKEYKYIVKLHPGETKNFYKFRYRNKNLSLETRFYIPWEVIYLNILNENSNKKLILISNESTALYNTLLINRDMPNNTYVVFLFNIISPYVKNKLLSDINNYHINKYKETFPNDKIYLPYSFNDLKYIFDRIYNRKPTLYRKNEKYYEFLWLRQQYLRRYKFLGQTITKSILYVTKNSEISESLSSEVIIDYAFDVFDIKFDISSIVYEFKCINDVYIFWRPFENNVYNYIFILDIELININGEKNVIDTFIKKREWIDISETNSFIKFKIPKVKNIKYIEFHFKVGTNKDYDVLIRDNKLSRVYEKYYDLLYKWLVIKQNGWNILLYFIKHNYNKVAIYGAGRIAQNLVREIQNKLIITCFITNKNAKDSSTNKIKNIYIGNLDSIKIDADIIVVTPIYEFDIIKSTLLNKDLKVPIISIDDIIDEVIEFKYLFPSD